MHYFLADRLRLVRELRKSDLNVDYADIALIVCSVISACAALRWPGRGIDRNRFIELLVNHSQECARTDWISIPSLVNAELIDLSSTPYRDGNDTRIFRDEEIDLPFPVAVKAFPHVKTDELKSFSYAALIYKRLRCGTHINM